VIDPSILTLGTTATWGPLLTRLPHRFYSTPGPFCGLFRFSALEAVSPPGNCVFVAFPRRCVRKNPNAIPSRPWDRVTSPQVSWLLFKARAKRRTSKTAIETRNGRSPKNYSRIAKVDSETRKASLATSERHMATLIVYDSLKGDRRESHESSAILASECVDYRRTPSSKQENQADKLSGINQP